MSDSTSDDDSQLTQSTLLNEDELLGTEASNSQESMAEEPMCSVEWPESINHVANNTWPQYKIDQLDSLIAYYADLITYVTDIKEHGSASKSKPEKPTFTLEMIMSKRATKATGNASKERVLKIQEMSPDEFHEYLKNKLSTSNEETVAIDTSQDMPKDNLKNMALYLKKYHRKLNEEGLKGHLKHGRDLTITKKRFDLEKRLKKSRKDKAKQSTWKEWIKGNTGISASYCRQLMQMGKLTKKSRRLEDLNNVSYTDLFKMRNKIKEVFLERPDIEAYWGNVSE